MYLITFDIASEIINEVKDFCSRNDIAIIMRTTINSKQNKKI
jgi:predicted DNA-binding protein with PD1-like motif